MDGEGVVYGNFRRLNLQWEVQPPFVSRVSRYSLRHV